MYEVLEDIQGEAMYHVLENTGGEGGGKDGVGNYEVPSNSSPSREGGGESLTMPPHTQGKVKMEYSTLQHQ